eukprot:GHVN01045942.1.p1 GENE.GHVN01045942.1~~GHVN01045942.1.p1  ORF type:complete len:147 (-),score=0.07 GHVN01045942.1:399-815(-)
MAYKGSSTRGGCRRGDALWCIVNFQTFHNPIVMAFFFAIFSTCLNYFLRGSGNVLGVSTGHYFLLSVSSSKGSVFSIVFISRPFFFFRLGLQPPVKRPGCYSISQHSMYVPVLEPPAQKLPCQGIEILIAGSNPTWHF